MGVTIKPDPGYMTQAEKNRISVEYDTAVAAGLPGYYPTPREDLARREARARYEALLTADAARRAAKAGA